MCLFSCSIQKHTKSTPRLFAAELPKGLKVPFHLFRSFLHSKSLDGVCFLVIDLRFHKLIFQTELNDFFRLHKSFLRVYLFFALPHSLAFVESFSVSNFFVMYSLLFSHQNYFKENQWFGCLLQTLSLTLQFYLATHEQRR
jgi:hypothetical protein